MAVESAADRAVFFDPDEFGVEGAYTLAAGGAAVAIDGIFDNAAEALFDDPGVVARPTTFKCRSADLPGGAGKGDQLVVNGITHTVQEILPDGTGVSELVLEVTD